MSGRFISAGDRLAVGGLPITVVTLSAPGFTVRVATEPLEIKDTTADGPYFADATLFEVGTFEPEVDLFGLERAEFARASVAMALPSSMAPASMERQWQWLAASRCEVAQIWPGQSWRNRRVFIGDGTISGLRLGLANEPIKFVVEASPQAVGASACDATRAIGGTVISGITVPTIGHTRLDDKAWPVVVGRCYKIPGYKLGKTGGAGEAWLGLAGHHFHTSSVPTIYEDGSVATLVGATSLVANTDSDGNHVTYIESDNTSDFQPADGAFTVDCLDGGARAVDGPGAALGYSGVLAWLLANCGAKVDWKRSRRCLDLLRGWEGGIYISKEVDVLKLLRERLVPILPIIEEQGEDGLWFRYADPLTAPPQIALVFGGNLIGRITGLEQTSDPDEIRNRIVVRYSYDHYVGDYTEQVVIDDTTLPAAALSKQLFGARASDPIEVNTTWDSASATRIGVSLLNRLALPRFAITYLYDPSIYDVDEGTIATLTDTDDDFGFDGRRCVIRKINAELSPPTMVVEPVPSPTLNPL